MMASPREKFRFAYSKRAISMIVVCVAAICILALATSTRPDEYQVMSGFMNREQAVTASRALLPHSMATLFSSGSSAGKPLISLGAGNDTESAAAEDSNAPLTAGEIEDRAQDWIDKNPHEARKIEFAVYLGLALLFAGICVLIFSEVSTVLVVQELDSNLDSGMPMHEELEERASKWARGMKSTHRPWLSLGGLSAMLLGTLVAALPLCSIIADWGLPEAVSTPGDCYTVVVLDATLQVVTLGCIAVGLCWVCTRPYASLLLSSIALGCLCAQMIEEPFFTLCWAVLSGFLAAFYLSSVPESQEGYRGERSLLRP